MTVSKISKILVGFCPSISFYTSDEALKRHSKIITYLKTFFENQGFKCEKEKEIKIKNRKGYADLYCIKNDKHKILIEAKSYPLAFAGLHELYQLMIYAKYLKVSEAYLAFSGLISSQENTVIIFKFTLNEIEKIKELLPTEIDKILEEFNKLKNLKYKWPGPWCRWCNNIKCPYIHQRNNLPKKQQPSIITLYHELVKHDISMMRGNSPTYEEVQTKSGIFYYNPFFTSAYRAERGLDILTLLMVITRVAQNIKDLQKIYLEIIKEALNPIYLNIIQELRSRNIMNCTTIEDALASIIFVLHLSGLLHIHILDENILVQTYPTKGLITLRRLIEIPPIKYKNWTIIVVDNKIGISCREFIDIIASLKIIRELLKNNIIDRYKKSIFDVIRDVMNLMENVLNNLTILLANHSKIVKDQILIQKNISQSNIKNIIDEKFFEKIKESHKNGKIVIFKTAHGELFRLLSKVGPLPEKPSNYEILQLPFLEEPGRDLVIMIDDKEIKHLLATFIGDKVLSNILIEAFKKVGYTKLTKYQYKYLKNILKTKGAKLISIAAPTGTGKTLIFIIYTLARLLRGVKDNKKATSIFIYPRKSLATDQLKKLIKILYYLNDLLVKNGFPRIILMIRDYDSLKPTNTWTPLRYIKINIGGIDYALEHRYIDTTKDYEVRFTSENRIEKCDWIIDAKIDNYGYKNVYNIRDKPIILITNMSMISKIIVDILNGRRNSKIKIFSDIIQNIATLVIDEAHSYLTRDELIFANFTIQKILYLSKNNSRNITCRASEKPTCQKNNLSLFDIIIASATISNRQLIDDKTITYSILGIKAEPAYNLTSNKMPDEIKEFLDSLLGPIYDMFSENSIYYYDYYTSSINPKRYKLNIYVITYPIPKRSSSTSLTESMLTIIHWILGLRRRSKIFDKAVFLTFIDDKSMINEIFRSYILERQIYDALDHVDRVLMSELYPNSLKRKRSRDGYKRISSWISNFVAGNSLIEGIWQLPDFFDYSHLQLYYTLPELNFKVPNNILIRRKFFGIYFKDLLKQLGKALHQADLVISKKRLYNDVLQQYSKNPIFYTYHHADLDQETRILVEALLKEGKALGTLCTSTLELGVDIDGVCCVLQYGSRVTRESFQQRVGRAGRKKETLFIATGILVLRNTGEDIFLMNEKNAINFVFNLELPPIIKPYKEIESMASDYAMLRRENVPIAKAQALVYLYSKFNIFRFQEAIGLGETVYIISQHLDNAISQVISHIANYKNAFKQYTKNLNVILQSAISLSNNLLSFSHGIRQITQQINELSYDLLILRDLLANYANSYICPPMILSIIKRIITIKEMLNMLYWSGKIQPPILNQFTKLIRILKDAILQSINLWAISQYYDILRLTSLLQSNQLINQIKETVIRMSTIPNIIDQIKIRPRIYLPMNLSLSAGNLIVQNRLIQIGNRKIPIYLNFPDWKEWDSKDFTWCIPFKHI